MSQAGIYLANSKSIRITCVHSTREDPSSRRYCCFYQAFAKHLLEFGLQVKVLQTPMHWNEQCGKLQLPVLHHQMQEVVGLGVIRNTDVLWKKIVSLSCVCFTLHERWEKSHHSLVDESSPLELDGTIRVCRIGPGVLRYTPFIVRGLDLHQWGRLCYGIGARGDGHMLCHQLTTCTSVAETYFFLWMKLFCGFFSKKTCERKELYKTGFSLLFLLSCSLEMCTSCEQHTGQ